MKKTGYDKFPALNIPGFEAICGYEAIAAALKNHIQPNARTVIVLELYPGCDKSEIVQGLSGLGAELFDAEQCTVSDAEYHSRIKPFLTEDRVFGIMNTLTLSDIYSVDKIEVLREEISSKTGAVVLYGTGASLVTRGDILILADLTRWEIQCRFKAGMPNFKADNRGADRLVKFKQGFFVEWRMADRHKKTLFDTIDYFLDTNIKGAPKMVSGEAFRAGLETFSQQPFRLVPYFAPEVWGGQWMKSVCGLSDDAPNYAWAFDGVPEENSICMAFNGVRVEAPALDLVFYRPRTLLGEAVHARFGDEFPIRFDFLDTMGGQNLSLQVHPLTEYIQSTFGMHYTQDESYYILDCVPDAKVFLGLKEHIDPAQMLSELRRANHGEGGFDAEQYVNAFPAKKHDHILIPAGTVHCSGTDTMVLEISATPYIFTFKLWDWQRLGLDGKPRPVHLNHGERVICWDRTTKWVEQNLVNRFVTLQETDAYREEHTGLSERQFIETTRHTAKSDAPFEICTEGSVNMLNVVDGEGAVIESTDGSFPPLTVHYAETFIVPEYVKRYRVLPLSKAGVMLIRAYVRH